MLRILCSVHQQSVLASLLVLPSVSVPASCENRCLFRSGIRASSRRHSPSAASSLQVVPVGWHPRPRRPRFIQHRSACGAAEDERAREGLGIRLCHGPGAGVGYLQRMAFQMDQLFKGLPAAMVCAQQRPAVVLQVNICTRSGQRFGDGRRHSRQSAAPSVREPQLAASAG